MTCVYCGVEIQGRPYCPSNDQKPAHEASVLHPCCSPVCREAYTTAKWRRSQALTEIEAWDGRTFRLDQRVQDQVGHWGTVVLLVSASQVQVTWDNINRTSAERVADLVTIRELAS